MIIRTTTVLATLLLCALPLLSEEPAEKSAPVTGELPINKNDNPKADIFGIEANVFFNDEQGMHAKDPYCNMHIVVSDQSPKTEYEGLRYHFCSEKCMKGFNKKPHKYIAKMALPANVVSVSADLQMVILDPVSQERVTVTKKTPREAWQGREYYFASSANRATFEREPEKYGIRPPELQLMEGTEYEKDYQ